MQMDRGVKKVDDIGLIVDQALDPAGAVRDQRAGAEVTVRDGLLEQGSQQVVDVRSAPKPGRC